MRSGRPLLSWLVAYREPRDASDIPPAAPLPRATGILPPRPSSGRGDETAPTSDGENRRPAATAATRQEDNPANKVLKVDQAKVDRLMNLIGEMVVAKNSLPYLANRAENQFGVRELARDIKAQYAVINRIAEEMQDAIMQVRMMPVSFVFQRFPRLVRDISRKLGKEVELVLEGEETEADKNIVEALADPLIHIVRNSLDHGLELPEQRAAIGKPRTGKLLIRAAQESDRVMIEIIDDGRGIDPKIIKRKAYERNIIDEHQLERISDQDAINLVFAPGFSTAETVSDLSGRGVGMDVVRSAIDRVGGTVDLQSQTGRGTTLRLSLPMSMAVTNVMIVESDRQIFGVPMDLIVETVRLPKAGIRPIKHQKTTVLRGRIVPLVALNDLLAIPAEPQPNADDELAALVVRVGNEQVGLLVDDFREVVDVILKPLPGELARLACYAGTALLGDGSVLMILNPRELF
jgi:two-component system chemotaxis sensor kinase CheA